MPYVDPQTVHNPTTGQVAPASWGDAVRNVGEYALRNKPHCKAYATTSSVFIPGIFGFLPANAEDWDVGGMHSTFSSNSRLTIPSGEDGKYRGVAWIDAVNPAGSPAGRRSVRVRKNGVDIISAHTQPADPVATTAITIPWEDNLVAGDYVQVEFGHTDDDDLDVTLRFFTAELFAL